MFFSKTQGRFILSLAFAISCLALFITLALKIGESNSDGGDLGMNSSEYSGGALETSLKIEEYVIYFIGMIQSYSLKEYAASKLDDFETMTKED